jgi:hypothetical protein
VLKFDPPSNPEMTTAADVIGSKFFYAFGYHVPENYLVRFTRGQIRVAPNTEFTDRFKRRRAMRERDLDEILAGAAPASDGRYRALASLFIPGDLLGPFRFYGTRPDDPNDIVPHEHRRDLRGLYVFSAWLNHDDCTALNTADTLIKERNLQYIRHYLIDFGSILGSGSVIPGAPRSGHEYLFEFKTAALRFFTFGFDVPAWQRARYARIPSVATFESAVFDPLKWKPNHPNPAFDQRLPDDTFWAARKVMAFTDDEIRAVVETGEYSDPRAVDSITRHLIVRRDKIGRAFFAQVLPLDHFEIRAGALRFEDLAAKHGFAPTRDYQVRWSRLDNDTGRKIGVAGAGPEVPRELLEGGSYFAADISGPGERRSITVYFRRTPERIETVGIDHHRQTARVEAARTFRMAR